MPQPMQRRLPPGINAQRNQMAQAMLRAPVMQQASQPQTVMPPPANMAIPNAASRFFPDRPAPARPPASPAAMPQAPLAQQQMPAPVPQAQPLYQPEPDPMMQQPPLPQG